MHLCNRKSYSTEKNEYIQEKKSKQLDKINTTFIQNMKTEILTYHTSQSQILLTHKTVYISVIF